MIEADALLDERLAYVVPRMYPLSKFLAWPETDQDLALAWRRKENRKCPNCHTTPEQIEGNEPELVATYDVCRGCLDVEEKRKQIPERKRPGARVFFTPRRLYDPSKEG